MSLVRYTVIAIIVAAALSPGGQRDTTAAGGALVAKMEAAYTTLDALHIKVKSSARYSGGMSAADMPPPGPDTLELRMQRPNKLFVSAASRRHGEQSSYLVVSDGATLSYWRSWTNSFVQTKAPAVLAGIARLLPEDAIGTFADHTWEDQSILEWNLLADDRTPSITKELGASGGGLTTTGPEKQDGALVHVVRLTTPPVPGVLPFTIDQRYYLDAESYLLRGMATSARGTNPENGRDFTVELRAQYELFSTRPTFSDADFRFVAPRGARPYKGRVEMFIQQLRGSQPGLLLDDAVEQLVEAYLPGMKRRGGWWRSSGTVVTHKSTATRRVPAQNKRRTANIGTSMMPMISSHARQLPKFSV